MNDVCELCLQYRETIDDEVFYANGYCMEREIPRDGHDDPCNLYVCDN